MSGLPALGLYQVTKLTPSWYFHVYRDGNFYAGKQIQMPPGCRFYLLSVTPGDDPGWAAYTFLSWTGEIFLLNTLDSLSHLAIWLAPLPEGMVKQGRGEQ